MCGIAALYAAEPPSDAGTIELLAERWLGHRGPDGLGAAIMGRAAVAHTRLAIVDLDRGRQPMFAENERTALVCNGEIYNHLALRERLRARHQFRTGSDSEVVLHLHEEYGQGCVAALDGMFAFFVTDGARFAAARDAFGIKPLYFGRTRSDELLFASEFKALVSQCESFCNVASGKRAHRGRKCRALVRT